MATVKINGKEITVEDNTLILDAARDAGCEIPTFCYQADLAGIGSCRMCLVEIEGQKKLQPSCVTPVLHGMSILTETPTVLSARASMLEFLLANHALDCPVCDKGGECELQDAVYKHGPHKGRHAEPKFKFHEKDYILSPVIIKNSNRCIQCMKCVRVCREVVGANVLNAFGRGDRQEQTSFLRSYLDCDQDGNCIEVCPVGCFMRLPYRYKTRPWDLKGADTVCPYCATGCRMVIEERAGQVIRAKAQFGVGINSETLCVKGRFGFDFINRQDRLTGPLVRKSGSLEPVSWDEALSVIKENFNKAGGEKTGGIASARLTNEELYLFQKLMRDILGSANIDSGSRWSPEAAEGFIAATGMPDGGVSVFDCMEADTLLIIGGHITDENPVTDYIVRRISAGRYMNVIMASVRAMRLDSSANVVLRHNPAQEGALLTALTQAVNNTPVDAALLNAAGISADSINLAAKKIMNSQSVAVFAGTEFLRFPETISGLSAFKEALKTRIKKISVMPLLDRCNQRGAWEMGVHPWIGPGYEKTAAKGLGARGMLEAAIEGKLDALYIAGEDVISEFPGQAFAREALSEVKFLVVQDIFLTETVSMASVVLPGAAFGEKDGTFTNQEGRVQTIRRLLKPPGKARTDLAVIGSIGRQFDSGFAPNDASVVFEEIRNRIGNYAEVSLLFNNKKNTLNRLDNREALVKKGPGGAALSAAGKAGQPAEGLWPFTLITGNHLFHSGSLSMRAATLSALLKNAVVEICEQDGAALGLKSGDRVRVKGARHEAEISLKIHKGSMKGVAFIAENFQDVPVNRFLANGSFSAGVSITKA